VKMISTFALGHGRPTGIAAWWITFSIRGEVQADEFRELLGRISHPKPLSVFKWRFITEIRTTDAS
jgi:hypothetical protein